MAWPTLPKNVTKIWQAVEYIHSLERLMRVISEHYIFDGSTPQKNFNMIQEIGRQQKEVWSTVRHTLDKAYESHASTIYKSGEIYFSISGERITTLTITDVSHLELGAGFFYPGNVDYTPVPLKNPEKSS